MERANPNPSSNLDTTSTRNGDPAAGLRRGSGSTASGHDPHRLGRRAWQRVAIQHPVALAGPHGEYAAQAVDLSRGGVLVAVEDPLLADAGLEVEKRVSQLFPDGALVRFYEAGIERRARVARVIVSPGKTLGIGCSFDQVLTTREAMVLGVVAGETHVPEVRLETLPFEPRPGNPLTLVLEDQVAGLAGPFALGPVLGTGEYSVDANLPQGVDALIASCGDGPFHAALVIGTERLWEGPASLVALEEVEHVGTRVRVLFEGSFDHRLARRLRRKLG